MAVDESRPRNSRCWVLKLGGLLVVVYWLIATVKSTLLVENSRFLVNLYNPGLWDLLLRIATAVAILGVCFVIQRRMTSTQAENSRLDKELASLEYLLEAADYPIVELDQQLRIKSLSKAAASLVGVKGGELDYQYVVPALFYSEDHDEIKALLEDTRTETESRVFRLKVRRLQPCYAVLNFSKEVADGKITRQLLFINDVSESKAKLDAAEKRAAEMRAQAASHPLPIAVFDLKHLRFANEAMHSLLNIPEGDISYERLVELLKSACGGCETLVAAIAQTLQEKAGQKADAVLHTGGQLRHVRVNLRPYGHEESGVLMWFEDITELAGKDDEIRRLEQEVDILRKNELELRSEFEEHNEKCSTERSRLLDELSSEQHQAARLREELNTANQQTADLKQQLDSLAAENHQLKEEVSRLQEDNTALANSVAQLEYQWDELKLPIMLIDEEGRLIRVNPEARSLLGLREDTLLRSYLFRDEQQQRLASLLAGLSGETQREPVELEFYCNGHQITVNCHGIKLRKPEGQFLILGYDITTLKQAQAELAMTLDNNRFELEDVLNEVEIERERMNAILAGISDGIVITDMYNRVIKMNPAAEDMLGIRLSQALERPVHFIIRNPEIIGHIQQTVREKLFNHQFDIDVLDPDSQSPMTLSCSTTVIHDRNLYDQGVIIQLRKA